MKLSLPERSIWDLYTFFVIKKLNAGLGNMFVAITNVLLTFCKSTVVIRRKILYKLLFL